MKQRGGEKEAEKNIIELSDLTFDEMLQKTKGPLLVDFWAAWCMPCRIMAPVVEELAHDYTGKAVFAKLNIDENPDTALRYQVMSIPTFIIFKNGRPAERIVGAVGRKPLEGALNRHL
ncbi:MAG: thioredoxin [Candidatus Bathyarchaeia archaeon]